MKKEFNPCCSEYIDRIESRVAKTEIVSEFSEPLPDDVVIWGTYSRTWKNRDRREVLKRYAVEVMGRVDSPTAHTRDYLMMCYRRKPAKKAQHELLQDFSMPLYAQPGIFPDASYVDIRSAWYAILCLVGWDCDYWPGRWLGRGLPPDDFPLPDHKVARSAMVTLAKSSKIPIWKNGTLEYKKYYNTVENHHVFAVIASVLNCIAVVAIDHFGCKYVNADGFIIPQNRVDGFMEFIQSWGLSSRVKASGVCLIGGAGAYSFGAIRSMRPFTMRPIDNIRRDVELYWLWRRVKRNNS